MHFVDEIFLLFIGIKPIINIYIDNSLDIDIHSSTLILLINNALNFTRLTGIGADDTRYIRYDEIAGCINFISLDISKQKKQLTYGPK